MNQEGRAAIDSLLETIKVINNNLNRLTDAIEKTYQRIDVLELDLKERSIRKKFFKSLLAFYPIMLVAMLWFMNADHDKIKDVLADVQTLSEDIKIISGFKTVID